MRGMRALRFVLAAALATAVLATAACSETIPAKNAPAPDPAPQAGEGAREPGSQAGEWRCEGALMPPTGWQQETAFSDAGRGAIMRAVQDASDRLVGRACGQQGSCDFLRARVTTWKTGRSAAGGLCAMAVLKSEDLAAWREQATSLEKLDENLVAAASKLARWSKGKPRVAIDLIVDAGAPGGLRADWLRALLEGKLGLLPDLM